MCPIPRSGTPTVDSDLDATVGAPASCRAANDATNELTKSAKGSPSARAMAATRAVLIGAGIFSAFCLVFRLGLLSFDYEARVLIRKGIDPDSMPGRRVRLIMTRGSMWLFGMLAVVFWIGGLIGLFL